jgi:hypothetical protein
VLLYCKVVNIWLKPEGANKYFDFDFFGIAFIQLQDLRRVIARMLGIDIVAIPVPDYEIVSRLEKLILANQTNPAIPAAAWSLSDVIDDMSDDFRSGYANAGYVLAPRRPRGRSPVRSSRSQSPSRRIDPKVY